MIFQLSCCISFSGISSLCFTNSGEALYMMSSSEVQRISLAAGKIIAPNGHIHVDELLHNGFNDSAEEVHENDADAQSSREANADAPIAKERIKPLEVFTDSNVVTNGNASSGNSPNRGNETITSSIGDITVDSVRDHLNTTTTTLCSTTTEETVGMYFSIHSLSV